MDVRLAVIIDVNVGPKDFRRLANSFHLDEVDLDFRSNHKVIVRNPYYDACMGLPHDGKDEDVIIEIEEKEVEEIG